MSHLPRIAFIGTGGTIASLGRDTLDVIDYGAQEKMLGADTILASVPEAQEAASVFSVPFATVPSPDIYFREWKALSALCYQLVTQDRDLRGIVIGHGTASLEETAYFLSLTLKVQVPVVLVGSQRPLSALSTDAKMNLVNAVRTAASPSSADRGVLVVLNDEIHAAREVTKTSTFRLHAFKTPDFGILGYVDGDAVTYYRRSERRSAPNTEFDVTRLEQLPRVDIAYSYAGADGASIDAFTAAGAKGIVAAGFAPGRTTRAELEALGRAKRNGVVVMQASRAGSGLVHPSERLSRLGFLTSDNLNPQKARILLALALTQGSDQSDIARIFSTY